MESTHYNRILFVEDNEYFRQSIVRFFITPDLYNHLDIAPEYDAAIEKINENVYDLAILDIELRASGKTAFDLIDKLRNRSESVKIVLFSYHYIIEYLKRFHEYKLDAYLIKDIEKEVFLTALKQIKENKIYLSDVPLKAWNDYCYQNSILEQTGRINNLSNRQVEVVQHVCEEKNANEIADILHIEPVTVKKHIANIAKIIGVKGKIGIVKFAYKTGLIRK